jgi:protein-tyrosine phosphatase
MRSEIFWIERTRKGLLSIMPRPRGGDWLDVEVQSLAGAGVNVLVSLLTADEVADLELQDEERLCDDRGIRFISFPIADRGIPASIAEAYRLVDILLQELRDGRNIGIHCRMGIGRSALIIACVLKSQGIRVDRAFAMISRARGFSVPDTEEQKEWVKGFAKSQLIFIGGTRLSRHEAATLGPPYYLP